MRKLIIFIIYLIGITAHSQSRRVEIINNRLSVDGEPQPQLFGAEIQYFRLRGGYGPNVPRTKVLQLWEKTLDHAVKAKMNSVSFYIPWDFHEYAEGKFDFTGTVDEDGDGQPDYPSRDILTFFKIIADHGITRIMVRPGPYINAEWGFLGFGAIPSWFNEKFPNSHMRSPYGLRTKLYDYHNVDLKHYTQLWFKALNEQVLASQMELGKPVIFLQLDNETNFQWQSLYAHDYSLPTTHRYQKFLEDTYKNIQSLNLAHGRQWDRFSQVQPPTYRDRNILEDQSWYRFNDYSIFTYLSSIRDLWQGLGIFEPQVLFTLAESYNSPSGGLLPHYKFRNFKNLTGLMTVNLYPKTDETTLHTLLNFPFKADLDVKSADEANDFYFDSPQEWVMGPEIQGGWWRGINISPEARQQTYLTVLGHGMKAIYIYYFNEGQNWGVEWAHKKLQPIYDNLLNEKHLVNTPMSELNNDFWNELQMRSDRHLLAGIDVRRAMKEGITQDRDLYFDAPLDGNADPRPHYDNLKKIGERVIAPYQEFLASAQAVYDDVAIVKDSTAHEPTMDNNILGTQASADWTGGLLGYLMNVDFNPRILFGDLSLDSTFAKMKALIHLDTGHNSELTLTQLRKALDRGQTVVNFLNNDGQVPSRVLFKRKAIGPAEVKPADVPLKFYTDSLGRLTSSTQGTKAITVLSSTPVYAYDLSGHPECLPILFSQNEVVGYRCANGLIQIGALLFEDYNSNAYAQTQSALERKQFMKLLLSTSGLQSALTLIGNPTQVVAFSRRIPGQPRVWITVKSGSLETQTFAIKVDKQLLSESCLNYEVSTLLDKKTRKLSSSDLSKVGFSITLNPNDTQVLLLDCK